MPEDKGKQKDITSGRWLDLNKPVILCIDRYKTLLPTVVALLTTAGYSVLTATTLAEGFELAAKQPIDALILDYTLCAHDHHGGACVTDRIRALQKDVKVVLWCADNSIYTEKPPCAEAVFIKPVAPAELLSNLDALLRS
jgi:CheY-like chemotaxis protein